MISFLYTLPLWKICKPPQLLRAFQEVPPQFAAEGIFEAATDGKDLLRYQIGEDAERGVKMRFEQGDAAFIRGMKERMLPQAAQN